MKTKNRGVILLTWMMLWMMLVSILPMNQANAATPGQISLNFGDELGPQYSNYRMVESIFSPGSMDIWHSSGGYWTYENKTIPDWSLKGNIQSFLDIEVMKLVGDPGVLLGYTDVPPEVRSAINAGKNVIVNVKTSNGLPIEEFLKNTNDLKQHAIVDRGDRIEFYSKPNFNFQTKNVSLTPYIIQDFNQDNRIKLPFVKDGYGSNGWSIYNDEGGRPYSTQEWASYSSWQDWNEFGGTKVSYQKMLPNSSGRLYPGFNIETLVKPFGGSYTPQTFPSKDIGVGDINNFKSGGSTGLRFLFPFQYDFYVEGDKIKEDVILTNLSVYEKDTSKPGNLGTKVGEFKREITNPLDPLNPANQVISASSTSPYNAFTLQKDKDYVVKSTYQFISFLSGDFNINNPATMSSSQKAITTNKKGNQLTSAEAYDSKAFLDGIFDKEKILVGENFGLLNLANNKTETFTWDFKFDNTKNQYVKIAGFIPEGFFSEHKNANPLNDWGALYGRVELIDMGLKSN